MVFVVELVRAWAEEGSNCGSYPFVRAIGVIRTIRIGFDCSDDLFIFAHRFCPRIRRVEEMAVAPAHVGNVPDCVRSWPVLKGGSGKSVGVAFEKLVAGSSRSAVRIAPWRRKAVPCISRHVACSLVPEAWVQIDELGFFPVLRYYGVLRDGIYDSRPDDSYRRLQADFYVRWLRVSVECIRRNGNGRVDELVSLAILELHRKPALHRCDRSPRDSYFFTIQRSFERIRCIGLRHSCHLANIRSVIAARFCRVIDCQKIPVSEFRWIAALAFPMPVTRMAVKAAGSQICRSQAVERSGVHSEIALE